MSIFASQTASDPIPIPFDPPHTIIVRKLTGRESDAAQEAHRSGLAGGSPRSWATMFRRALEKGASDPEVLKVLADPLTGYDRFALVRAGLVSWSYPQSVKPVLVKGKQGLPDQTIDVIEDLDDEAVNFIATEVLRVTKPGLFLTAEEDVAAAQKELSAAAPAA